MESCSSSVTWVWIKTGSPIHHTTHHNRILKCHYDLSSTIYCYHHCHDHQRHDYHLDSDSQMMALDEILLYRMVPPSDVNVGL